MVDVWNGSTKVAANVRDMVFGNGVTAADDGEGQVTITTSSVKTRYRLAAASQLTADAMSGPANEVAHTAITIAAGDLNEAGARMEWAALMYIDAQNSTDTWTFRAYLGGMGGDLLFESDPIDLTAAGNIYTFEGSIVVKTTGATGTFDANTAFEDQDNDADGGGTFAEHTADLTGALDLVITGECSTTNAGNQVTQRAHSTWAEVTPA